MNTREKFKRRVIELIHDLPYDDAIRNENNYTYCPNCQGAGKEIIGENFVSKDMASDAGYPEMQGMHHSYQEEHCRMCQGEGRILTHNTITIGRVMQALENFQTEGNEAGEECAYAYAITGNGYLFQILPEFKCDSLNIKWKLTKENGEEANDDFQDDETIEALYNLIK